MASRTSQTIFSGKCRKGVSGTGQSEDKGRGQEQTRDRPSGRSHCDPPRMTLQPTSNSYPKRVRHKNDATEKSTTVAVFNTALVRMSRICKKYVTVLSLFAIQSSKLCSDAI